MLPIIPVTSATYEFIRLDGYLNGAAYQKKEGDEKAEGEVAGKPVRAEIATIATWMAQVSAADLHITLRYRNTRGDAHRRRFGDVLLHFFNHQTHHRGQATTLLSQAGAEVGATDLMMLIAQMEVE